ncbi:hypothetical protein C7H19_24440 [Aphanothece hegewaldii CCALA 016]|uniref:Uncharacterized protein n=1 Tax=Aphanothece hegewaldii CCALA 016 TaxID=2107694 RepID=A0A2T1LQN9_9CHRO|nr:hypothetical protein [Aphanothece hegewaldii]PSF29175.1 hypothetical protein C7H19_24440 [Aphanothece hegewaldii CCALA 016]
MILATDFQMIDDDQFTCFCIGDRVFFAVPITLDECEKITRLHAFVNGYNSGLTDGYNKGQQEQADKIRHALMLPSVDVLNNF